MGHTQVAAGTREERLKRALFRGASLTLENADYRRTVCAFTDMLLQDDLSPRDLTAEAVGVQRGYVSAVILARENGVVAGLAEVGYLLGEHGVEVVFEKQDGDGIQAGDTVLRAKGAEGTLLSLERVGLNLLQRMSGIATAARGWQERVRRRNAAVQIVGTRKTPCGMLDKRALHLGNGGTHRLGLGDAILIKNNHLALLGSGEKEAAPVAIERAWKFRGAAAFIEVEVRSEEGSRAAAETFSRLQSEDAEEYPCLLMLDNMPPGQIEQVIGMLQREGLHDGVLMEASGGISEESVEAYADSGVDAISVGALTHSARALDISQRVSRMRPREKS